MQGYRGCDISDYMRRVRIFGLSTAGKFQWDVSVVAEEYPSLWSRGIAKDGRSDDQHDAFSVAEWMRRSDLDGRLTGFLVPDIAAEEQEAAQIEGWILGIK